MCTLGPATSSPERIRELVDAGMDVARLNLSHGTYAEHEEIYRLVREASDETGHGVGIFVDLQGPKIRLGQVQGGLDPDPDRAGVHDHHPRDRGRQRDRLHDVRRACPATSAPATRS